MPPPLPGVLEAQAKLRKELCIFLIGLGVILAVPAYFILTGISETAPRLWDLPRHLAVGVPVAVVAGWLVLSGVLLAILRGSFFAILGALATVALALFYFFFMVSATGRMPFNLISILIGVVPILVGSRVGKYLSALKGRI
jgi:hypothetical protein